MAHPLLAGARHRAAAPSRFRPRHRVLRVLPARPVGVRVALAAAAFSLALVAAMVGAVLTCPGGACAAITDPRPTRAVLELDRPDPSPPRWAEPRPGAPVPLPPAVPSG